MLILLVNFIHFLFFIPLYDGIRSDQYTSIRSEVLAKGYSWQPPATRSQPRPQQLHLDMLQLLTRSVL